MCLIVLEEQTTTYTTYYQYNTSHLWAGQDVMSHSPHRTYQTRSIDHDIVLGWLAKIPHNPTIGNMWDNEYK